MCSSNDKHYDVLHEAEHANLMGIESQRSAAEDQPLLTVIIPVFNEQNTLNRLLQKVLAAPYDKQIVVVDDGSTDGTADVLQKWEGHCQIDLLQHTKNQGKGAAIRTGLEYALGQFTIIQDADLEYDPQDYPRLIEPLLHGHAQVTYGSRYLQSTNSQQRPWRLFRYGVLALNICARLIYKIRLTDEATCYKAFPTSLLKDLDLQCERFEFCPEVTAKVARLGLDILEVPIRYHPRGSNDGKKIRWQDGLEAIGTLWRWRKWQPKLPAQALVKRRHFHAPAPNSPMSN